MEKAKNDSPNWLTDTILWLWSNKFITIWALVMVTVVCVFIGFVFFVSYSVYTDSATTPEMRMAVLQDTFIQCLEMGIYPETCEQIAAEAAGLTSDD